MKILSFILASIVNLYACPSSDGTWEKPATLDPKNEHEENMKYNPPQRQNSREDSKEWPFEPLWSPEPIWPTEGLFTTLFQRIVYDPT